MLQTNFNLNFKHYQTVAGGGHLSRSQRFGLTIERWVTSELIDRGHSAVLVSDFNASYDILVGGHLPVEVKAAVATRQWTGRQWRDRWQFCLSGGLDYHKQDFLYVLVAVDTAGAIYPYVVPSGFIGGRQHISLTSHPEKYRGWLRSHLSAWQYVDTVSAWRYRFNQNGPQLSLFDWTVAQ